MKPFRTPRLFSFVLTFAMLTGLSDPARADSAGLRAGMQAVASGDFQVAMAAAGLPGTLEGDIIEWHRLRSAKGGAGLADYVDFLRRNPDWPGLPYLKKIGEAAIPEDADPAQVIAFFGGDLPQTGVGALRLIAAHRARNERGDAEALAVLAWRNMSLSEAEQNWMLEAYGGLLESHHRARLDNLGWEGRVIEAERMYPLVSADRVALARARAGLRSDIDGVDALIAAVPAGLQSYSGLAFERFAWRMRKGRLDDAGSLLLAQSSSARDLGDPSKWARDRRRLARVWMREGRTSDAYLLASRHYLTEGSDFADLEWLSGYLALRFLNDPAAALKHFQRFRKAVDTPISLGRAGYWEGRAHEAMGNKTEAQKAYGFGALYQTSFYGLLAAERAGLPMDPALMGTEVFPDWRQAGWLNTPVVKAALLLYDAGETDLGDRFLRHYAESLNGSEMGQMADMALEMGEPHLALTIAKYAADQGIVLNRAYYPLPWLAKEKLPVPTELALSIARRESEFDPKVTSRAGARGLMQLMPGTAKMMATKTGQSYDAGRLLTDPAYNASLGSAYLAGLIEEFGANFALVAAGYNAGPGRPRRWIEQFGDPRSEGVDPIDWIEMIPFEETQNYVMRVMESLPVYRARLHGKVEKITMTADLKAR